MLNTPRSTRGMVSAPHHLAARAGLDVLAEGGNAVEAMVAAAATIAVVYPHMNAIGGDGFWLIADIFLIDSRPPAEGELLRNPRLADTLERLAAAGLADFYQGEIGAALAADLAATGSPLTRSDLSGYQPLRVTLLSTTLSVGRVYNLPPPTQGPRC